MFEGTNRIQGAVCWHPFSNDDVLQGTNNPSHQSYVSTKVVSTLRCPDRLDDTCHTYLLMRSNGLCWVDSTMVYICIGNSPESW